MYTLTNMQLSNEVRAVGEAEASWQYYIVCKVSGSRRLPECTQSNYPNQGREKL